MTLTIREKNLLPVAGRVTLGKSRTEAAATLTATVYLAAADNYYPNLTLAVGDAVRLTDDKGKPAFLGSVHELRRTPETVTFTAFDRGVYLTRNELSGVLCGSGEDIVRAVAGRLGLGVGTVDAPTQYKTIVTRSGESAFHILRQAVGEEREIYMEGEKLTVRSAAGTPVPLGRERFLRVESVGSIRRMVNRAVVLRRNGALAATAANSADAAAYGQFQTVETLSGKDAAAQARNALRPLEKSARVTLRGDLTLNCGGRVRIDQPEWGLGGLYAVTAAEHVWEKGVFTTELDLEETK